MEDKAVMEEQETRDAPQWSYNDPAVIRHVDIYQGLIARMAGNSAACKQWAIALVSAVLVLVANDGQTHFAVLAGVPAILFAFLDAYYLALEKQFRNALNTFLNELSAGYLHADKLFRVRVDGKLPSTFLESLLSWSVWPFYLGMLVLVALAKLLVF